MTELFGTSGIRGEVGRDVTADLALAVGRAVAMEGADRVVVGRDPRLHGELLADAVASGLRECGADVVRLGVVSTPTVARSVAWEDADAGVSVTASHNPPADNGLKLWTPSGQAYPRDRLAAVEEHVRTDDPELAAWDETGASERVDDAPARHVDALRAAVEFDDPPTVAVDVGNGAGRITADALVALGCEVHTLNAQPDGRFPARPSEPTPEACRALSAYVANGGVDLGVAHDGDADRMRAVAADGRFLGGDELLAVFARAVAGEGDRIAAPINTSHAVDDALADVGAEVVRTAVGDGYVAERAAEPDVIFGGEPSGAWIWPDETRCPDGPLAAVKLTELVARAGSLDALCEPVPDYPIRRDSVETPEGPAVAAAAGERLRERFPRVSDRDGVRAERDDGWVLVRPSGTQPLVRLTAEARDPETADRLLGELRAAVEAELDGNDVTA